jgi:hypothetical protein
MASKSPRKCPVSEVPASPTDHPLDDEQLDRFRPTRTNLVRIYLSRTLLVGLSDIDVLTTYWRRRTNGHPLNVGLVGDTQTMVLALVPTA